MVDFLCHSLVLSAAFHLPLAYTLPQRNTGGAAGDLTGAMVSFVNNLNVLNSDRLRRRPKLLKHCIFIIIAFSADQLFDCIRDAFRKINGIKWEFFPY